MVHEQAERRPESPTQLGDRVRGCLRQFLSRINTEVVLSRTCLRCGIPVSRLGSDHADRFLQALRPSLALYVTASRADQAIRTLQPIFGKATAAPTADRSESNAVEILDERDIESARTAALRVARAAGLRNVDAVKCATVVSELARNIYQYAGTGRVSLVPVTRPRPGLRIEAEDQGPGIANVTAVLSGRYRSATGLGLGLQGSQRLMDEFEIESAEGSGTRVSAIKYL